jgi:hypothetical protein
MLSLREASAGAADWDRRLASAAQPTAFAHSAFLQALGGRHRRLEVVDGQRLLALLPLTEDGDGEAVALAPFTPYQGPIFLHAQGASARQRQQDEFRVCEHLADALAARYRQLRIALPWTLADMRPFLWHHYHQADARHYHATPRYTAVLPLAGLNRDNYPPRVRACRRQEWRKAQSLQLHDSVAVDDFLALYQATFERQGQSVTPATLALVRRITEAALAGGWGWLSGCGDADGLASATLFVRDSHRAYYLFGANDPAQRSSGASTRLLFENIFRAAEAGLAELDFVGVNSPDRGDYKLSFDPQLRTCFELALDPA